MQDCTHNLHVILSPELYLCTFVNNSNLKKSGARLVNIQIVYNNN